jgi:hypothetical protein
MNLQTPNRIICQVLREPKPFKFVKENLKLFFFFFKFSNIIDKAKALTQQELHPVK